MQATPCTQQRLVFLKLTLLAGLVTVAASVLLKADAEATSISFNQQILPLNCIFTTINAGTGKLYYVTPEACGVYVPPLSTPPQPVITATPEPKSPAFNTALPDHQQAHTPTERSLPPPEVAVTKGDTKLPVVHSGTAVRRLLIILTASGLVLCGGFWHLRYRHRQ